MGKYEPVKATDDCDLPNDTAVLINPGSVTLVSLSKHCNRTDEDLEMALPDSHSRSSLPLHNAAPAPSKVDDAQFSSTARPIHRSPEQCHRLVSLDVFRGITVAVILSFPLPDCFRYVLRLLGFVIRVVFFDWMLGFVCYSCYWPLGFIVITYIISQGKNIKHCSRCGLV